MPQTMPLPDAAHPSTAPSAEDPCHECCNWIKNLMSFQVLSRRDLNKNYGGLTSCLIVNSGLVRDSGKPWMELVLPICLPTCPYEPPQGAVHCTLQCWRARLRQQVALISIAACRKCLTSTRADLNHGFLALPHFDSALVASHATRMREQITSNPVELYKLPLQRIDIQLRDRWTASNLRIVVLLPAMSKGTFCKAAHTYSVDFQKAHEQTQTAQLLPEHPKLHQQVHRSCGRVDP
mmetsp:Transcript_124345/g.194102  ORF Transcript_124345/g.194102 Transcript_124345/m.194102 type:complete len:236 (-) Transcript_124345:63-770(-)